MSEAKQFDISKKAVIAAFQAVKENAGSYGAEHLRVELSVLCLQIYFFTMYLMTL